MSTIWILAGVAIGCEIVILAAVFVWTLIVRRKRRLPLEFKLLRGPGETLRKNIVEIDENLWMVLAGASLAPIGLSSTYVAGFHYLWPTQPWANLITGGVLFLATLAFGCAWIIRVFSKRRNLQLGYLGERAVGEHLEKLRSEGFRVFHDVPAENGRRRFNIDHVVVGHTGVFVIETKTRRKGRIRPGFKDYEVTFDGRQIIWPWGEDRHGLDQAANEAEWIGQWLNSMTGLSISPRPILALPRWFVVNRANGPVTVLNEKNLASAVRGYGNRVLTDEQISFLARQLDARCRDVDE